MFFKISKYRIKQMFRRKTTTLEFEEKNNPKDAKYDY